MELLDLAEAAATVQVSTQTLRNYIRAGRLKEYRDGKRTQVDPTELQGIFACSHTPALPIHAPRIFAVCNHKGGVGKTTTVATLGYFLAGRGQTLLIDADPQAHLTQVFGIDSDKLEKTLYEIIVKGYPLKEVLQPKDHCVDYGNAQEIPV